MPLTKDPVDLVQDKVGALISLLSQNRPEIEKGFQPYLELKKIAQFKNLTDNMLDVTDRIEESTLRQARGRNCMAAKGIVPLETTTQK